MEATWIVFCFAGVLVALSMRAILRRLDGAALTMNAVLCLRYSPQPQSAALTALPIITTI
eukprot:6456802-Amphidinium_carterae.2